MLDGFETATLSLPTAFDGPVSATLIRKRSRQHTGRAVLYLHGFIDYFFQAHMAERYEELGYSFYALDLRRYGRSLQPGQRPNYCNDLTEYYADIDAAIEAIDSLEDQPWLLLSGHSTGGLIGALYAHEGQHRARISGLFLNSPFFDFNATAAQRIALGIAAAVGRFAPGIPIAGVISPLYAQSIHSDYRGVRSFNTTWKPIAGFPAYTGWLRAIGNAQRRLRLAYRSTAQFCCCTALDRSAAQPGVMSSRPAILCSIFSICSATRRAWVARCGSSLSPMGFTTRCSPPSQCARWSSLSLRRGCIQLTVDARRWAEPSPIPFT